MTDMTTEQALEWLEGLRNTTGDQVCAEIEAGKAAEAAQAFRAALSRPAVPEGWKLVPVQPTEVMKAAGCRALGAIYGHYGAEQCWKAMLAAAPEPAERRRRQRMKTFEGWYCAHCQRGVDASEVTFHEQHTVCGRTITDDTPPEPPVKESLTTEQPEDGPVAVIRIIPGSSPRDDLESHPVIALHRPSARNRSVSLQQDDDTNVVQWHVQSPDGFWRPVGHRFSLPSEVAIRTRLWHENQRLRERVKELEADAARYRWLRSKGFGFSHDEAGRGISAERWGEWCLDSVEGFAAQADAAIDAAMQEGKS